MKSLHRRMAGSLPEVDSSGFVVNAFFCGPRRKLSKVARALGIIIPRAGNRIQITPRHRVTPERLARAEDAWESA